MGSQGFRNIAGNPFVYQEDTRSAAFGLDAAAQTFKVSVKATAGALPTDTAQFTIDPAANGNVTIDPNGSGNLVLTSGNVSLTAGNLVLPNTSSTVGQIIMNSEIMMHRYGTYNTFVGRLAGNFTLTGGSNFAFGGVALDALTSGSGNVAIGNASLTGLSSGGENCALGTITAWLLATGSYNVFIGPCTNPPTYTVGTGSAYNGAESSNILISHTGVNGESNKIRIGTTGSGAGQQDTAYIAGVVHASNGLVSDAGNISSTSGSVSASTTVTAGTNLVSTAGNLLLPNTVTAGTSGEITFGGNRWISNYGDYNTFVGENSGNTTLSITGVEGEANVGIGYHALMAITKGDRNCFVGRAAGTALTEGRYNLGFGDQAMVNLTIGTNNTGVGSATLRITTGIGNCAIGNWGDATGAGFNYTSSESYNILLSNAGVLGESNKIRIGTNGSGAYQQNACYIAGIYGVTPGGTINIALVDSNGQLGSVASLGVAQGGTGAATLTDHGVLLGSGTGAITPTAVGATGEVLIGNTGADASWSASPTLTSVLATTFDTNVAAAGVTLSGVTLSADGSDADININITAKGAGKVIIDDLQLTTDLAVTEGGTGASTLTDHGILLGSGTGAITPLGEASNGQLPIGSTGADPVLATLTASTGITVTNAAGAITLESTTTTINSQGDSYTLVLGDAGKLIKMTKGTASTLTIPKNASVAFPVGTFVLIEQSGAGQVTVSPVDGDVTIHSSDSLVALYGQYSVAAIVQVSANVWCLMGDLV